MESVEQNIVFSYQNCSTMTPPVWLNLVLSYRIGNKRHSLSLNREKCFEMIIFLLGEKRGTVVCGVIATVDDERLS